MTLRSVARVLVRAVGLHAVLTGLVLVPVGIENALSGDMMLVGVAPPGVHWSLSYQTTLTVLYLVGGVVLMRQARPIARYLTQWNSGPVTTEAVGLFSPTGFRFCLRLLGAYLLIKGLPLISAGLIGETEYGYVLTRPVWRMDWTYLGSGMAVVAVSVHLLRGGDLLMRLAGVKMTEDEVKPGCPTEACGSSANGCDE